MKSMRDTVARIWGVRRASPAHCHCNLVISYQSASSDGWRCTRFQQTCDSKSVPGVQRAKQLTNWYSQVLLTLLCLPLMTTPPSPSGSTSMKTVIVVLCYARNEDVSENVCSRFSLTAATPSFHPSTLRYIFVLEIRWAIASIATSRL